MGANVLLPGDGKGVEPGRDDQRRFDEVARPVEHAAAETDLAALRASGRDRGAESLDGRPADERSHQHSVLEWIADLHRAVCGDQAVEQRARDGAPDEEPPRARAALPGGAHRTKPDGADRPPEV